MTSLSWGDDVAQPTPQQRSLLADRGGFFSCNPALSAGEIIEANMRLLAVVLVEVCDRNCSRWVLQELRAEEPCTGRWRFPGTVFAAGEMPLLAAARAVTEQIELLDAGVPVSWDGLEQKVLGVAMDWLPELRISVGQTCHVEWENTLVFTYHARLVVQDIQSVRLRDAGPAPGRRTLLAGIVDLQAGIEDGSLCSASEKLWKGYWQQEAA